MANTEVFNVNANNTSQLGLHFAFIHTHFSISLLYCNLTTARDTITFLTYTC